MANADAQGNLTLTTVTPSGLPAGVRTVRVVGDQGTVVEGHYIGSPVSAGLLARWASQRIVSQTYEPVAQTFRLDESRIIGAIDLEVCHAGATLAPIRVQIRDTIAGLPNNVCLGESILVPADFSPEGEYTRFEFSPPVPLLANAEYAFVVITEDPDHKLAYARIGEIRVGTENSVVTQQPYQIGVLLVSSNASTWTAVQDADLRFKIMACKFTQTTKIVDLGKVTTAGATDLRLKANVLRPFGAADAKFQVKPQDGVGNGVVNLNPEDTPIQLFERHVGDIGVKAVLYGDEKSSPIIAPNTQLAVGNQTDFALYHTVEFLAALSFNAKITFDAAGSGTGGVAIRPFIAVQRVGEGGEELEVDPEEPEVPSPYVWQAFGEQESVIPLEDGWIQQTWIANNLRGYGLDRKTRFKFELQFLPQPPLQVGRPLVQNLRVVLTPGT